METKAQQPKPAPQTIQSKTQAKRQAPIEQILQRYQSKTMKYKSMEDEDELLQGEFKDTAQLASLDEEEEPLQGKFETAQRQDIDEDELLQGKFKDTAQLASIDEEEEPLQAKFETAQRQDIDEDELLQGKFDNSFTIQREEAPSQSSVNKTGLPDNLKSGVENLSGYSMDSVRVHYNSDKPAQLQALAYTQGTDIHVAPGQEKHLPHEAWHVVQQMQGRVQPTMQMKGVNVNDNEGLEREAAMMGYELIQKKNTSNIINKNGSSRTIQCQRNDDSDKVPEEVTEVIPQLQQLRDGYSAFDENVNLDSSPKKNDITFGVELEVVHKEIQNIPDSIKEAKDEELTDATKVGNGTNKEKWQPTADSSLDSGLEEKASVEWVSPVYTIKQKTWNDIKKLCKIIRDNDGFINDSCSEHIHVGHQSLELDTNKFSAYYKLYKNFEDVIDVIARGGNKNSEGKFELRKGADGKEEEKVNAYAKRMNDLETDEEPVIISETSFLDEVAFQNIQDIITIINKIKSVKINKKIEYDDNEKDKVIFFIEKYNDSLQKLRDLYAEIDNLKNIIEDEPYQIEPNFTYLEKKEQKNDKYDRILDMCKFIKELMTIKIIAKSYYDVFEVDPTIQENRYKAVNIHQNFSEAKNKPTIEIRRFNGAVDEKVVQANVLLSTSMMNAAATKDFTEIDQFINDHANDNKDSKPREFFNFISINDTIIGILSNAYNANKNEDE